MLSEDDIHAHNSFDHANAVAPKRGEARAAAGRLVDSFPPASVVRLTCELG